MPQGKSRLGGQTWHRAFVAAMCVSTFSLGCNRSEKIAAAFRARFIEDCVRNQLQTAPDASEAAATPICECAATRFMNGYEANELKKIPQPEYVMGQMRAVEACQEDQKE